VDELRALYLLTDRLYRARSLDEVYEAALEAILQTLGCDRASILLFDDDGVMRFVAWRGLSERYRHELTGHSPWKMGAEEPEPILVYDILESREPDWIKSIIVAEGIRGLGFIPVVAHGMLVGKFMTYYARPHEFAKHETELAVTIARQVGFSVERARAEELRRFAEDELRASEARFRLLSEQAPVMIWMSDPQGACLHLNRMLRDFWGVSQEELPSFDWRRTAHPEDVPNLTGGIEAALTSHSPLNIKARFRNVLGEYRVIQTDARPRFSARGEFLGMIGVNNDITERELSEQVLRQSEERFRLAVEAAPSGMVMTDGTGRIVLVNANAEALFGYRREELEGRPIETLVPMRFKATHPAYRDSYGVRPSSRPMGDGRDLFALRKDGTEVPVEIGLSPIVTPAGLMTIAAIVDISGRKRADSKRDLLLAELNHRVKNTLAVVQAIALRTFKDAGTEGARQAFQGRLTALAVAHDLLTREHWESTSLAELATDTLQVGEAYANRILLAGPQVLLPPKQTLAMTLALHELFINAVKYGALSEEAGIVFLGWQVTSDRHPLLRIIWREEGGPKVAAPTTRGFGSFLIERTLAHDMGGTVAIDYTPAGLVCSIEAPFPSTRGQVQ
jgi:PAS domain S-box-containing protein